MHNKFDWFVFQVPKSIHCRYDVNIENMIFDHVKRIIQIYKIVVKYA